MLFRSEAAGPMEVTAADIKHSSELEVFNPDMHIATLEEGGQLIVELDIAKGRGYVPAEQNKDENTPIAVIPVDSIYTPVKKVNYRVENTRVGQVTEFFLKRFQPFTFYHNFPPFCKYFMRIYL